MRLIVFFDLPSETRLDKVEYLKFRKYLIKSGFLMMQESVYCKLLINQSAAKVQIDSIKRNKPVKGNVQVLLVTEKQYSRIEYIVGEYCGDVINSDDRYIEV